MQIDVVLQQAKRPGEMGGDRLPVRVSLEQGGNVLVLEVVNGLDLRLDSGELRRAIRALAQEYEQ